MQKLINDCYVKFQGLPGGKPASYIPELSKADPKDFAIVITTVSGDQFSVGDSDKFFTLQSSSKPFIYGMALQDHGREKILSTVGVEPTGEAFNSIVELEKHTHRPYNPMINSGAIAISSLIKGETYEHRVQNMLKVFETFAGERLQISPDVFQSEKTTAHRNRSIAHLLRHFDVIDDRIDETLDLYFGQCSVMATTKHLSMMAATLANRGVNPKTKQQALETKYVGDVLSLMFTCGMYDSSGEWAYSVGIPAKSGVSGVIFGVVPGEFGIAVYSPPIDRKGHSVRGLAVFEELSHLCNLSIFRKTTL